MDIAEPTDVGLDHGWTKGNAWINGFALAGTGPQRSLFAPAPVLGTHAGRWAKRRSQRSGCGSRLAREGTFENGERMGA